MPQDNPALGTKTALGIVPDGPFDLKVPVGSGVSVLLLLVGENAVVRQYAIAGVAGRYGNTSWPATVMISNPADGVRLDLPVGFAWSRENLTAALNSHVPPKPPGSVVG
jgi:hypothetical protein